MMMNPLSLIRTILEDILSIQQSPVKKNRFSVLLFYIRSTFKGYITKDDTLTTEKFIDYKISGFRYKFIFILLREIFIRNEYYFKSGNSKPIIFDCGANIGIATLYLKWLYPQAVVYAFEPDPETFKLLAKNVQQNNLKDVHCMNAAISSKKGIVNFFSDTLHSGSPIMSTKQGRIPLERSRMQKIKSIKLSSQISKSIDFLKLDIEGSEHEAIKDLQSNNKLKYINEMVIEYHHNINNEKSSLSTFLSILEKAGFEYQIVSNLVPSYSKKVFQDILIHTYRK